MNTKEMSQKSKGDFIFSPLRVILYILMMTLGIVIEIGIIQSYIVVGKEYLSIVIGCLLIIVLGLIELPFFFYKRADELSIPPVIFMI